MQPAKRFLTLFVVVAVLSLAACSDKYNRVETGGTERINAKLDKAAAVLVVKPNDAVNKGKTFKGSGEVLARMIDASFSHYARIVDVYPSSDVPLDQLRDTAAKGSYGYIVLTKVIAWGPKDDEWYKPINQATIKMTIIDALTGNELSSNVLDGKGAELATLNPFNMEPEKSESLLVSPIGDYVDSLYDR